MTLEETARIFSEKWGKDINRTHIASAKRMVQNIQNMITADLQSVVHSLDQTSNEVSPIDSTVTSQMSPKLEQSLGGVGHQSFLGLGQRSQIAQQHNLKGPEDSLENKIDSITQNTMGQYPSGLDLYSHFIGNAQKVKYTFFYYIFAV